MEEKKENNTPVEQETKETVKSETTPIQQQQAQVIGEIPKEKQKGVFGLIVFFAILFGVTFGLPYIKDYIDAKNTPTINGKEETEENNNQQQAPEEELVYYEIDQNTDFTFNNLKFRNFSKETSDDFYLNLTVENASNNQVDLNDNYYLELYNSEKTLLERVKIISNKTLSNNESLDLKLLISENSYNNAVNFTIGQKEEADYPEVELSATEDDYNVLTCNDKTRNIKYYFKEESLEKISDVFEYSNSDANAYNENLRKYMNEAASLSNVEGISSDIVDTSSSFTMNTQVDLSKVNKNNLPGNYYFVKGTKPKVVKFKMSAMRYTCN